VFIQVNEETGNRRPIELSVLPKTEKHPADSLATSSASSSSAVSDGQGRDSFCLSLDLCIVVLSVR
jgi:hypothetical protein